MNSHELKKYATTHQNIMELLVNEEIERQLAPYPSRIKKYINKVEVATHALNRLPALYASSEEGKVRQYRQGHLNYKREIKAAVRRALAAVEQDPIRTSTPLTLEDQEHLKAAENALIELQNILQDQGLLERKNLSWNNLTGIVKQALNQMVLLGMKQGLRESSISVQQHHESI